MLFWTSISPTDLSLELRCVETTLVYNQDDKQSWKSCSKLTTFGQLRCSWYAWGRGNAA